MTKEQKQKIYAALSKALTVELQRRRILKGTLAREVGDQFLTIKRIEEGKPFEFHHAFWLVNRMGIDLTQLLTDIRGDVNGTDIKLEDFI